ncbi:GNAT family N-acetyltransferase [Geomicrobium sediminis]|uniref:GNAT superfamily N-acetyltransferase n=1 Tax=Geomicrobium sediminis TaxID=1347788 RepID=A0ABS2PCI1_9BACL|nr:GNAT family N-acetyltransferase [Geomicrobium sediminis]MBM7633139.1 GNAT superfamily N-acetyltransferase [Geomicrobium sediminis]
MLEQIDSKLARDLLDDLCPTQSFGIVEGFIEGAVYSDRVQRPRAVLIATKSGTYTVHGEPGAHFVLGFSSFYMKKSKQRFTLFSPNIRWDTCFEKIQSKDTMKMSRVVYHLDHRDKLWDSLSLSIRTIDEHSIEKSPRFNENYYVEHWGSVDAYKKYGIGYYVEDLQGEILAECTFIFRSREKANIDIYTRECARGKGLASTLVLAFVKECRKQNITPMWDCDEGNEASMQLAKRLGFSEVNRYHLYYRNSL